ncbi:MAG: DNA-directed RNA polymerase subunit beta [Candidatus Liptonbacteria bacterium]|nr:DNA-directed RNA polymerase subunit beta [Candidatus Liptonbacteria bacterium]
MTIKYFSHGVGALTPQPDLSEIQTQSYRWFLGDGLKELFGEVSPIKDYTGKEYELHFDEFRFDEPKYNEVQSIEKGLTFEAALRATLRLVNLKSKKDKTQDVYIGDVPLMTARGTFIINGVERVVISQLIRSPGVYFTAVVYRGKKLFGAKVIPNRGAWLELETDPDGLIGVKIDRRRKVPITDLLRAFASMEGKKYEEGSAFTELFKDIDVGPIKHLQATLKKDAAKNFDESYLEIYKRLRPGDLATPENAKSLIDAMFKRFDRYDLSMVGRFKMNQRLQIKSDSRLLRFDDLVLIVKELIRLNNDPMAEPDDIDHLGNRRVRAVGELLQNKMRVGFARLRRVVQDRMSTIAEESFAPGALLNVRPLMATVKEFFASSQLSQFMDQVNPLSEIEHKRRLSAMGPGGLTRERAGFEVRDVHTSHYGRICPIQTPEGANIGLINYIAGYARISPYGFLETPYVKVKNGVVTNEVVWLDALEEEKYKIAHGGIKLDGKKIVEDSIEARIKGAPGTCPKEEVDFMDISPEQFISVSTSLIPFLRHDDANRALMGSNMQRQAVIAVKPQVPYVGTGVEEKAAHDSGYLIKAEDNGEIVKADATGLTLKYKKLGTKTYELLNFKRSNQGTSISQRLLLTKGSVVKKGETLVDGPGTVNGVLGLGQNLLVAFASWEGANFEDAIILSERVVQGDRFSSIYIEDFYCDVRDTKLGPEIITPDISNVSEEKLKNLDEEGIVRVGAEVRSGDILVGKISPKGETELTSEERLLRAIFGEKARDVKDTSLTLPHGKYGRIVGVKIFSRERGDRLEPGVIKRIQVEIAQLRNVRAGDKLAGRHGNKGVISQIRPVEDMPYLEDGTTVDIILNPLGVTSRMNIGQILETHLGWAAHVNGFRAVTPALSGASEEEIRAELRAANLPESGKVKLYDGRVGRSFDKEVMVGYIYIMKLNHLVEDKIHMRSIGPYSLVTQQPLGGKAQFGGQRFGEMEVWALEGYGAAYTLQEMLTIKSDDIAGRSSAFESIIRDEPIKAPNVPATFSVLTNELKALGLGVELLDDQGQAIKQDRQK